MTAIKMIELYNQLMDCARAHNANGNHDSAMAYADSAMTVREMFEDVYDRDFATYREQEGV